MRTSRNFAINMRGALLWGIALAMAEYLAVASLLAWLWQRNAYNRLTWSDAVLYPIRRREIAAKKGEALIAEGKELWRQKRWHEAAVYLRHGIEFQPGDLQARLIVSGYYVMLDRREVALDVLSSGLTDRYPGRSYLDAVFHIADQYESFELEIAIARRYAAALTGDEALFDRRWLQRHYYAALIDAGRAREVVALSEASTGSPTDAQTEYHILALLALGRAGEAVPIVTAWSLRASDVTAAAALRVCVLREAGRLAEFEVADRELASLGNARPELLIQAIVEAVRAGLRSTAAASFEEFVFRFGADTSKLQRLADHLAMEGDVELVQRCADAAEERGHPMLPYDVSRVRAHVKRGEWTAAAEILARMPAFGGREAAEGAAWREWMQRLVSAAAASTESSRHALYDVLRRHGWSIDVYRESVNALKRSGRLELAQEIAVLGSSSFTASVWLQEQAATLGAANASWHALEKNRPDLAAANARESMRNKAALTGSSPAARWPALPRPSSGPSSP
jgi:hypothetical protein